MEPWKIVMCAARALKTHPVGPALLLIAEGLRREESLSASAPSVVVGPAPLPASADTRPKVYVFSNVRYPEENKITPGSDDVLVFLNKAFSASYYADFPHRILYRRSPNEEYGKPIPGCENRTVFGGGPNDIPKKFINELKRGYDWNYPIEEGKARCATTGYMVVKYLESIYPDREIVLVNFGYGVEKSTYRCPWHNWTFEAEQLKPFRHIYLEEGKK